MEGVRVEPGSQRWRQITTSQYAWEEDALNVLRALLPDASPFQVWTNFQFTDGGRIHEVDALVITPKGGFVVEIKSWSGTVEGDQGTWTQIRRDGSRQAHSNPANLTAEKVRALASLVRRHWSLGPHQNGPRPIFLHPLVWFSNPDLQVRLPSELRSHVALADDVTHPGFSGISDAIITIGAEQAEDPRFTRINEARSDRFVAAMDRIGIRESTRNRTAGSYVLELPAFAERGNTQDFTAIHRHTKRQARVRIYSNVNGQGPDQAVALRDAAKREHNAALNLRRLDGVIDVLELDQTDFGPAIIFDHDRRWRRLDLFLGDRPHPLPLAESLRLVEALAGTLREVHRQRITHRMLTPQSVWLKLRTSGGSTTVVPLLADLSLAARETGPMATTTATHTRMGILPAAGATAVEFVLGDRSVETYLAPEAFTDPNPDGVALDVYSLGALAYLLITGRPPADDRAGLRSALGQNGLSLAAVMPEVDPSLEAVIRRCTTPIVSDRFDRMADVAAALAVARANVTGERHEALTDPLLAEAGDTLASRFKVLRRLGKGSTATALWCRDLQSDRDVVLKVSLGGPCDDRVRAEGERLTGLDQANIVKLLDSLELSDRPTLVLSFGGERSLANVLREDGAVSSEFLQRWGDDLLEAVRYLERVGVSHRDIKPDNLGIVPLGVNKQRHLVLYDFSLASARAADTDAGTPPYLEPFLGGERTFDLAAERYAAAVTLYEMATGETPVWGDGRTDPAFLAEGTEVTVLAEVLDEGLREPLSAFFAQALRRDPSQRFDTAEDMLRAWNQVFAGWEHAERDAEPDNAEPSNVARLLPETLALADPISSFGGSRKVASALRKCGATTVRDVAGLDAALVNRTRGVSVKTRRQIVRLRAAVLERFADELSTAPVSDPTAATPAAATPTPGAVGNEAADVPPLVLAPRADLDSLGLRLVPPRAARGRAGQVADAVRAILGLDPPAHDAGPGDDWPTATAVAATLDVTRAAVSNAHNKARSHWGQSADLVSVIPDLVVALADLGGVAGVSELTAPLLDVRPTGLEGLHANRLAAAVLRAAVEASGDGVPDGVFAVRRFGRRTIVALDGAAVERHIADGHPVFAGWDQSATDWSTFTPESLTALAVALGGRADELVADTTLASSSDVVPALRTVRSDAGRDLSDSRMVRLAAASSDLAATNAGSDLVALAASAAESLRWSRPALIGSASITIADLRERVAVRFPTVELPERPALDNALAEAGLPYGWDDVTDTYKSTATEVGSAQLTVGPIRAATVVTVGGRTVTPSEPLDPKVAAALAVQQRLDASAAEGGFLALRVPTNRVTDARDQLSRWVGGDHTPDGSGLVEVDLEAVFLRHLRAEAKRRGVGWSNVQIADDPLGSGWTNLSILAATAVEATLDEVRSHRRVLAWFPGALVRHGTEVSPTPLDQLRAAATDQHGELELLWLVVLGGQADALPSVDGAPVPIVAPSEWLEVTEPWLTNRHRGGDASPTDFVTRGRTA